MGQPMARTALVQGFPEDTLGHAHTQAEPLSHKGHLSCWKLRDVANQAGSRA